MFIIKTLDSLYCCKKCSDVAYARKKRAEAREKQLALIAKSVPKVREYLSIREAVAIYGVERDTLYLMVRRGQIQSINIGTRLTRINRKDLEKMFVKRPIAKHIKETPLPKKYSLEPEDCYTIGEVCEKYHINDSSVWTHVRKYSIPSRQIGNFVYVPKEEIDKLYKSKEHTPDLQIKKVTFGMSKIYIVNIQTVCDSSKSNEFILEYLSKRSLLKNKLISSIKKDILNYTPSISHKN